MVADEHATSLPSRGDGATQDLTPDGAPVRRLGDAATLPDKLGRYHVLRQLGAGGMGVVLTAYDPDLDRKVALKLLRPGGATGSSGRLLREAHALARLSHPNVVQIYDTGAIDGQIFIAMELVHGVDLRAWLARPHPIAEVLRVFLDAGRGLAAAHDAGFVHRDFKPDNVLLGADGRVRVADFGLVRQRDEESADPAPSQPPQGALDRSLTRTGALLGTPAYMSPEQHLGLPADARSDQFSFCIALWEALHGQRPFAGDTAETITSAVLSGQLLAPPRSSRTPRALLQILARGMAREPDQRYPSMHALLAALARDGARTRRRWLLGLAAAGLLTGAAFALRSDLAAPCEGGPAELAPTWNPARREAVAAALARAADPELATRVLTGLDAYADAWIAGHRDACLDHRRGEQSSALLDARMRCLDRRRQTLASAAELLTTLGEPTVAPAPGGRPPAPVAEPPTPVGKPPASASAVAPPAPVPAGQPPTSASAVAPPVPAPESEAPAPRAPLDAAQLVARLPAVAACDVPAVVLSEAAVPEDPALAAQVDAVASLLIDARVRHDAGDLAGAQTLLTEAIAQARHAQFQPILAEALLAQVRVHFTRGAYALARPVLTEALTRAVESRRDDLAAEAIARLLYVDGVQSGRADEALRLAPLALAMATRAPEPHAARGLFYNNLSGAQVLAHDREGASASLARAVEEMQAAPRHDPIELAGVMLNAAIMTAAPDERRVGLERATGRFAALLGPRHLLTLDQQRLAAVFMPEPRAGAALLAATCPAYLDAHGGGPLACKFCFHRLAHYEMFLGDAPRALATAERVLACRTDPGNFMDAQVRDKALAFLAVHTGRPLAALDLATAARARIEPQRDVAWMATEFAELELLRGRALLRLGRIAEAVVALERSLPALTASAGDRPELPARLLLAEAQSLLAQALAAADPPDPARAARLTATAAATFAALGAKLP